MRLAQLALLAGIHPSHLIREFRKYAGLSPIQYVVKYRIACAATLLLESDRSIKEIGYSVGFRRPEAFSAAFKRQKGYSPKSYRKLGHQVEATSQAKEQSKT